MWYQGNYEMGPMMQCGCNQVKPAYPMRRHCKCPRRRANYCGNTFVLIVVLFILLIIVGANFKY